MADLVVRAPEIDPDLEWLNTGHKPTLRALRGQLVVLDFWTYCCINCMHVVPVLRRIEERFAREPLVVLGVHSAKFDTEQDPAHVRQAIARYGIEHPVLVDRDMRTWSAYAVRSWPTLVVVRPDGTIGAVAPGEPSFDALAGFLEEELARARSKGTLAKAPYAARVAAAPRVDGPLAYPGKVAPGPEGRIAIADSGHHRVLVVDAGGQVLHTIGSGMAGGREGPLDRASFDDPQGIAWRSPTELFVADARAHVVARVDLAKQRVDFVAGTGELALEPMPRAGDARATPLRSPWDLCLDDDGNTLFVALAGSHQIASLDLALGRIARVSGTGAESIVDGSFDEATFSQPSGLARVGRKLYVADSETSSVRELDLETRRVRTVVGRGLFDFGDRDGPRETALLQHCIGIAADPGGRLVVADTYNGKLRRVDAPTGEVQTLAVGLSEPAGLGWDGGAWLVADTNAHRVVRVSPEGEHVEALVLRGAPEPRRGRLPTVTSTSASTSGEWFTRLLRSIDGAALAPGRGTVVLDVVVPSGKKLADGSPMLVTLEVSRRGDLLLVDETELRILGAGGSSQRIEIAVRVQPFDADAIEAEMTARVDAVVCDVHVDAAGAVCEPWRAWLRLPLRLAQDGGDRVKMETVPKKKR